MRDDEDLGKGSKKSPSQQWDGFTFFCGDSGEELNQNSTVPNVGKSNDIYPLSEARSGDRVLIVELLSIRCIEDLREMGFSPGQEIQVISRTTTGSVIVLLQTQRIGLGKDMAKSILVRKINQD